MSKSIIVAERGWIFVGDITRDGDSIVINDAKNIRHWGTTSGLGELALEGPKAETQLDHYGVVRIHVLAVVAMIECDETKWMAKPARSKK